MSPARIEGVFLMALFFSNTSYSSFHLPIFWVFIWLISQKVPSNQDWKLSSLEFTCLSKCLLEYSSMKTSSLNKFFLFPWKKKKNENSISFLLSASSLLMLYVDPLALFLSISERRPDMYECPLSHHDQILLIWGS